MRIVDMFFIVRKLFLELTAPFVLLAVTHQVAVSEYPNKFALKNRKNIVLNAIKFLKVLEGDLFHQIKIKAVYALGK